MTKYATAFVSFFDNIMKMSIVEAESEVEALTIALKNEGWDFALPDEVESLLELAFSNDVVIGAIEISEP